MIITTNVTMDLLQPEHAAPVPVMQDDRYCRQLAISLYKGEEAWAVPEGASALVRYCKADGKGGEYDTLPDGTQAWSAEENVLTVALAPQVLTVPGPVRLQICLIREEAQISTFPLTVHVRPGVGVRNGDSEDYRYVVRFLPLPEKAEAGQYFRAAAVDELGRVTALEAVDAEVVANTIRCEAEGERIRLTDASGQQMKEMHLFGRSSQDGTGGLSSAGEEGSIRIFVTRKNLTPTEGLRQGFDVVTGEENSSYPEAAYTNWIPAKRGETFGFRLENAQWSQIRVRIINDGAVTGYLVDNDAKDPSAVEGQFTVVNDCDHICVLFLYGSGASCLIEREKLTIQEDDCQSLTVWVPGGLAAIPVDSGGSYRDAAGQQWISDEVDLNRGVYIQRIGRIEHYAGEVVAEPYLTGTGELSEGAEVLYVLGETQEIALDAAHMEAFRLLETTRTDTLIFNDADVYQKVSYVADTKAYIDRRIEEITA